ncbi:hypothetical protein BDZ45DRAFT_740912 [Acephala macrosclerotiorum]|nr:hypothetical protein BDZ45DRAFT_740912 [Acephala macrosclerotiorum]
MASVDGNIELTPIVDSTATTTTNQAESERVPRGAVDSTVTMATNSTKREMVAPGSIDSASTTTEDPAECKTADVSRTGRVAAKEKPTRIPYNNDYGDFQFYPFTMLQEERKLDGFERSEAFPFFEIPSIIRNKIYQLPLRPLFSYSKSSNASYVLFLIECDAWACSRPRPLDSRAEVKENGYITKVACVTRASTCLFSFGLGMILMLVRFFGKSLMIFYGPELQSSWVGNVAGQAWHPFSERPSMFHSLKSRYIELWPGDDTHWLDDPTGRSFQRGFHVQPSFWQLDDDGDEDYDFPHTQYGKKFADIHKYLFELMMPNTLRPKKAETEIEIYLEFRL